MGTVTVADLVSFEEEIAQLFRDKQIPAPVHLSSGNEEQLISIFRVFVKPADWVLCSWRSHLHCLLKGVPRAQVKAAILAGRSIALCFPEYRVLSSAIVGGIVPIACGLAAGIARRGDPEKVHCFLGDMSAACGITHEAANYAENHDLPLRFIVEDNGLSVGTPTADVWGYSPRLSGHAYYRYKNRFPHCGLDEFVQF